MKTIESIVEELRLKIKTKCECLNCSTFNENIGVGCVIREALKKHEQAVREDERNKIRLFLEEHFSKDTWNMDYIYRSSLEEALTKQE